MLQMCKTLRPGHGYLLWCVLQFEERLMFPGCCYRQYAMTVLAMFMVCMQYMCR